MAEDLNYNVGQQSVLSYVPGDTARDLTIFDAGGFAGSYRVTVTGDNVLLTLQVGTSGKHIVSGIQAPARFVCSGPCNVFAEVDDADKRASARVLVARVEAGEAPNVGKVLEVTAGAVALDPSVAGVRALVASTLTVRGVAVVLATGQAVEIRGPATLDTGAVTALYEV